MNIVCGPEDCGDGVVDEGGDNGCTGVAGYVWP